MNNSKIKKALYFIFNVFLPTLVGGLIYVLYRSDNILFFEWINFFGLLDCVIEARSFFNNNDLLISNFLTQNLPDGLWIYSFTSCLLLIWGDKNTLNKYIYFFVPIALSIVSELCQLFHILPGTFDLLDILAYLFFTILANKLFKIST